MFDFLNLKDKRILITGASSGIGRETAILLSKLGAKTILVARDEERLKQTLGALEGAEHRYYCFDLREISGIEEFMQSIVDDCGKLDGFVHSAGVTKEMPVQLVSFDALNDIMLVNFYAFMELVRSFSKKKINNGGGSIVALSSTLSLVGAKAMAAYCASKAALDGAIRALAHELHSKNIRINSVVPGFVKTEMGEKYLEDFGGTDHAKNMLTKQYMGAIDTFHIANTIAFLLSDASLYINGQAIPVDAGSLT